ncbi:MAG TPA: 30S ribosomal protein S6 [Clostridiales bacterium]|nr:30S ribosomal protein S6 [Clostridiales bacterium]
MKKYEMLYILDNAIADEAKEAIIAKFEQLVKDNGGVVEGSDKWGARKLAYLINDKSEGYYVLLTFESEPSFIKELDRVAGITENVMRRLVTVRNA